MADDAIHWLNQLNDINPTLPFFLYYVPGGTHAPHQPTPEWIKKISDMHLFDKGWNALRDQIFANQKKLGVIPQDAKLTPWPDNLLKNWDQTTDEEKKLFIRQADVYAAYLAYTDHEIGRVIQAVEDMGKLDNTLIIYISGDNGASAEGSPNGTPSEVLQFNGVELPVAEQMKFYDAWGTPIRLQPYGRAVGLGVRHAVQVDEAGSVLLRRHAPGHGDLVAGAHQGQGRHPLAVPSCDRHRADAARSHRHPRARHGRRHRAEADRRRQHGLHLRQGERRRALAAQDPVFRDDGRAGPLQRRLDAERGAEARAVGIAGQGDPGPGERLQVRAVRRAARLDAVHRRRGRQSRPR